MERLLTLKRNKEKYNSNEKTQENEGEIGRRFRSD